MGRELIFDRFSQQALQTLHRYRAVMFSPTLYSCYVQSYDAHVFGCLPMIFLSLILTH